MTPKKDKAAPETAPSPSMLRALHIEDNPADRLLIKRLLEQSQEAAFVLEHAETLREGLERAGEGQAVVLLDLDLPDSRGLATIERFCKAHPRVPVLVVTGHLEREVGLAALAAGAHDHVVKDELSVGLLERRIAHAMERARIQARVGPRQALGGLSIHPMRRRADDVLWNDCAGIARDNPLVYVSLRHPHTVVLENLMARGVNPAQIYVIDASAAGEDVHVRALDHVRLPGPHALEAIAMATEDGCRLRSPGCQVLLDDLDSLLEVNAPGHARDFLVLLSNRLHSIGVSGRIIAHDADAARRIEEATGNSLRR